jgi:hypothetical protein
MTRANWQTYRLLFKALDSGKTPTQACIEAGIGYTTYYRWRENNEKFGKVLKKHLVKNREAYKTKILEELANIGQSDWKSRAWLLERQFNEFKLNNPDVQQPIKDTISITFKRDESIEE